MIKPYNDKILLLQNYLPPPTRGGSGVFLRELFRRFPANEVDALTGIYEQPPGLTLDGGLKIIRKKSLSLKLTKLPKFGHLLYALIWLWHAYWLCRQNRYRLVVCGEYFPTALVGWGLRKILGLQFVVFLHGEDIYRLTGIRRYVLPLIAADGIHFIANSANTKRLAVSAGIEEKAVVIITPCVDHKRFQPAKDSELVKKQLGLAGNKVILTVARMTPRKGHKRLITALNHVVKVHPDTLLIVIGPDFGYRSEIERHIAECKLTGHVMIKGNVTDSKIVEYYQACDIFVMVSDTGPNDDDLEGFGITFLEANACGKPVIGGNTGGMPEAIEEGHTGYVVNNADPMELEERIIGFLDNPNMAYQMGLQGRKRVIAHFDYGVRSSRLRKYLSSLTVPY